MPFKSKAQMRYMYANHPDIAQKWMAESGATPRLPEKKYNRKSVVKHGVNKVTKNKYA